LYIRPPGPQHILTAPEILRNPNQHHARQEDRP